MYKYMITKNGNPRSESYGTWKLAKYEVGRLGNMDEVEEIALSEKRKPLIELAKEKNIKVFHVDSGRTIGGCKW